MNENKETINKDKIIDDTYIEYKKKQNIFSESVTKLSRELNTDIRNIGDLQAEVISLRQILLDEMMDIYYTISKLIPKNKIMKKKRLEFYMMEYPIKKLNSSEKIQLIEADMAYHDQLLLCNNEYIEYLKETIRNVDNLNYSIKNRVDIINIIKE